MSGNSIDPLEAICEQNHPVADLAREFLARGPEWSIDDWFIKRAKVFLEDAGTAVNEPFSLKNLTFELGSPEPRKVRLVSIRPFYFRGFQELERPIGLDANLVTVDGRNSSGKTSLAEAIEWLLSGNIQRREHGDPNELADFIANRFRPNGQKTWVKCNLAVDGEIIEIKRVLIDDYGTTKNSFCTTRLFINGVETEEFTDLLADYFSGVAPLQMQHTLRELVLESPGDRPKYFEKLLYIDEISDLIAAAQVSKLRQSDIPRPRGGTALADWQEFTQLVGEAHFLTVEQYSKLENSSLKEAICNDLVRFAADEFGARCESDIESCITVMNSMREKELQRRFPALRDFQPKENYSEATFSKFSDDSQNGRLQLEKARKDFLKALEAQETISKAKVNIAKALEALRGAQLIKDEDPQTCPVCEYQPVATLTQDRIAKIASWIPTMELVGQAKGDFERAARECHRIVEDLRSLRRNLVPLNLPEAGVQDIVEIANSDSYGALLAAHVDAEQQLQTLDSKASLALAELEKCNPDLDISEIVRSAFSLAPTLQLCAEAYARKYEKFREYLNELATSDEEYRARDSWLNISQNRDDLILDFQWETAKNQSRKELEVCRDLLIVARLKYLELRRNAFSDGITDIWSKLRRDEYSSFSELVIPEPRGKGQKARIEVKAKLSSKSGTQEVHALSVLSESQINAIGIAAFVTRSRLLGHNVLVFDDPVQSMDDDHFRSFADVVLSYLCDEGFQVIVLTHNENFARDVCNSHSDRKSRISMDIRHTPNKGITVDEGNRSVTGLLNMSSANWEDGKYESAWTCVRKAIERLFILIRMKHGKQPFDWRNWKSFTAGKMWRESIKDLLDPSFSNIARQMPDIVDRTAGGAHIRQASGFTDYSYSVEVIRKLQCEIQVGD